MASLEFIDLNGQSIKKIVGSEDETEKVNIDLSHGDRIVSAKIESRHDENYAPVNL
jgi:hypothetical protein